MNQNILQGNTITERDTPVPVLSPALAVFERFLMALQSACFGLAGRTYLTPPDRDCEAFGERGYMAQMALVVLRQRDTTELNFALRLSFLPVPTIALAFEQRDAGELVAGIPEPGASAIKVILHPVTPSGKRRLVFGVDTLPEPTKRGCLSGGGRTLLG
jgi:hypothetical protein